jgi:hypothetical protein
VDWIWATKFSSTRNSKIPSLTSDVASEQPTYDGRRFPHGKIDLIHNRPFTGDLVCIHIEA